MEIESKFTISNPGLFDELLALTQIGSYSFKEPLIQTLTDHYLDTATGLIRRGGFACRLRHNHTRGTWVGALKGLGSTEGAIHQREEFETEIPPLALPDQWPPTPARELALRLSQAQPLIELFAIHQRRRTRNVFLAARQVGELSLDEVEFQIADRRFQSFELEIELSKAGTLNDLHLLGAAFAGYGLQPESKSKFERGLELLGKQVNR